MPRGKKWYNEEYEWEIEVAGFLHGDHTERYCRNGEEIGDKYTCIMGCRKSLSGVCYIITVNSSFIGELKGTKIANLEGK